jgi:hypothetical protein
MRTTKSLGALVNELRIDYRRSDIAPPIDLARMPERHRATGIPITSPRL